MLKNYGISLVSLIITIVAIIILATIAYFNGIKAPDTAIFTRFTDEMASLKTSVATKRANNFSEYGDVNYGFKYVTLVNAPDNFVSFADDGSKTGYLIDLNLLDFKPEARGTAVISGNQVTFGKDDVYVYDKNGAVYYVAGVAYKDGLYYNAINFE